MQRILDIDLDFFVEGAAHWRESTDDRLDAAEFPPWPRERALSFLEERCKLDRPLPGFVVEHHGEMFTRWRSAIDEAILTPPFEVTHIDAHADLGLGDNGYVYLMTSLLFEPPEERRVPQTGDGGLADGNWLIYAIACRWLAALTYVLNTESGPPGDILTYVMEGFDPGGRHIELPAMHKRELDKLPFGEPEVHHREPKVPFTWMPWPAFTAPDPFDVVCLARSPGFTPRESDPLFDEIRERFIDEAAFD